MINSDEFSILNSSNSTSNSYFKIVTNDQFNVNNTATIIKQQQQQQQNQQNNQTYLQPIKIFQQQQQQQQQSVPQTHYQIHQFKNGNINDEIISPLSNSSSTSSSSSMSSLSTSSISSLSSLCNTNTLNNTNNTYNNNNSTTNTLNNCLLNETNSNNANISSIQKDKNKLKIKSLNDNYVSSSSSSSSSNKSNQKKLNNKKKTSQTSSNDLDEERTSQLVSELLRNIKEKTKQLESLNQHMKSSNTSDSKCNNKNHNHQQLQQQQQHNHHDSISNSPAQSPSINTSISFDTINKMNTSQTIINNKKIRNKVKNSPKKALNQDQTMISNSVNGSKEEEKYIQAPNGWQRLVVESSGTSYTIVYKSPSGVQFNCLDEIKSYLLEADTCKCGLECPLNIYETFNFDITIKNHLPFSSSSSSSSLTDLSNKSSQKIITNCCFHKAVKNDSVRTWSDMKRILNDDSTNYKKNKITDENDSATSNSTIITTTTNTNTNSNRLLSLDLLNDDRMCYQFSDDDVERSKLTLDANEFSLIQLNTELDSNYLSSLNLNEDLDLIQLKTNVQQQTNENNHFIINNDLLMSSSISSSSLTNTPVILSANSANLIMDFSTTSNNNGNNVNKNIFNFYTTQEEKNFDKAILRMISNDCNEMDDSLELNVSSHHYSSNVNNNNNNNNNNQSLISSNFIPQDLSDLCRMVND